MGKRRKGQKPGNKKSNRRLRDEDLNPEDMDDEIDACKNFFIRNYLCNSLIFCCPQSTCAFSVHLFATLFFPLAIYIL